MKTNEKNSDNRLKHNSEDKHIGAFGVPGVSPALLKQASIISAHYASRGMSCDYTTVSKALAGNVNEISMLANELQATIGIISEVAKNANIPRMEIPKSAIETLMDKGYLNTLKDIQWPLFLEHDPELRERIDDLCPEEGEDYPLEDISREICCYFSNEKVDLKLSNWMSADVAKSRKAALEEAILLHKQGLYYGSTALLMCQVGGIIEHITRYTKDNNFDVESDFEKFICEDFDIEYDKHKIGIKHNKEKDLMFRLMIYPDSGFAYWRTVTEYLYNITMSNEDKYMSHNPMRNKVCHGFDDNFGTEEKSLKSILIIDLLINLYFEIELIVATSEQ